MGTELEPFPAGCDGFMLSLHVASSCQESVGIRFPPADTNRLTLCTKYLEKPAIAKKDGNLRRHAGEPGPSPMDTIHKLVEFDSLDKMHVRLPNKRIGRP